MSTCPIAVPTSGPVVLPDGRTLPTYTLQEFADCVDMKLESGTPLYNLHRITALAKFDGMVLCTRATERTPAQFGVTLGAADDFVHGEEYDSSTRRARGDLLVVDPYDVNGDEVMFDGLPLTRYAAYNVQRAEQARTA